MIKIFLRKFFQCLIYPTKARDWYKEKGYVGRTHSERFADFIDRQSKPGAVFYKEFLGLGLTRHFIKSGKYELDAVIITNDSNTVNKDTYFVFFQGRGEYYESRFRDKCRQCRVLGATVIGFNPKGFHSSTGQTRILQDLVDDGVAVINYLLTQGAQAQNIILQGNSLGSAVQEAVSKHFKKKYGFTLRQINGNSFKNISSVIAYYYRVPSLEPILYKIISYSGWEIDQEADFYTTGPHRCYLRRAGDRTILPAAEYHIMIDHERDYLNCPEDFRPTLAWLNSHNVLIPKDEHNSKDPHILSLHLLEIKPLPGESNVIGVYEFIGRFSGCSL